MLGVFYALFANANPHAACGREVLALLTLQASPKINSSQIGKWLTNQPIILLIFMLTLAVTCQPFINILNSARSEVGGTMRYQVRPFERDEAHQGRRELNPGIRADRKRFDRCPWCGYTKDLFTCNHCTNEMCMRCWQDNNMVCRRCNRKNY